MHKDARSKEEYLECIYKIQEEGRRATTNEMAKRLAVKQASVTGMLDKLSDEKLVAYESYHGAVLTRKGAEIGRAVTRKHRIIEAFLCNVLKVDKNRVHTEACLLEHALSDDVESRLIKFLGKPYECPDDHKPIPYVRSEFTIEVSGA
jgi:DtxR family Mn-dependent transcriptional regulator